ncbi:MAG: hydantoinase/oxoprolinase family protein [Proteobacteria bacterium]|nr:hydantoinase/oxoprolinase family protein [Pseudomonadota bacterium]MDA1356000.1 hydantoinase/oxoprolinase family protein [Pseudomonadota bacterium]
MGKDVSIDVGGTFTDFVAYDRDTRKLTVWKTLSTPDDPGEGIVGGLEQAGPAGEIEHLRFGTTIATNAVLERKGATVAYVATHGFRDVPFIQRGKRQSHYDITWIKSKPLMKRRHAYEVAGRITSRGDEYIPLDEAGVRDVARRIARDGRIQAIAVCLLFSYVTPVHERRVKEIFGEICPDIPVSISYDVLPKWKEHERSSTTLADAYIKPLVSGHLASLSTRFAEQGVNKRIAVIKSNGGEMTLEAAAQAPIQLTLSGPTGGVVGAKQIARLAGVDHLVTLDMGGTSTDVSTVVNGRESFTTSFEIEFGVPIQIPMIDIRTMGAGGGSLAWIDKGGMLRVGPESAGAAPGPACYGQGGSAATVTDANLVLGRINPTNFLGGQMALDVAAAESAIAKVAAEIDKSPQETALGIVQIANNNMIGALRSVLTERGLDPRDFTLLAFGGAGPVHISDLMPLANIPSGIVPNYPGQFSAFGFTMTDARIDVERTTPMTSKAFRRDHANGVIDDLVRESTAALGDQGYSATIEIYRSLEMRYFGQNHELEVPIDFEHFDDASIASIWQSFHAAHKARYNFDIPGETIELISIKVTAISVSERLQLPKLPAATSPPEPIDTRSVIFDDGAHDAKVYDRAALLDGHRLRGPALIEEPASITVIRPGQDVRVDTYGNLLLGDIANATTS